MLQDWLELVAEVINVIRTPKHKVAIYYWHLCVYVNLLEEARIILIAKSDYKDFSNFVA